MVVMEVHGRHIEGDWYLCVFGGKWCTVVSLRGMESNGFDRGMVVQGYGNFGSWLSGFVVMLRCLKVRAWQKNLIDICSPLYFQLLSSQ